VKEVGIVVIDNNDNGDNGDGETGSEASGEDGEEDDAAALDFRGFDYWRH
jgi:hypothetical protein